MCEAWDLWENKTGTSGVCPWGHPHPAAKDWHSKGQRKRFGISYKLGFLLPAECRSQDISQPFPIIMELLLQRLVMKKKRNGITDHWKEKGRGENLTLPLQNFKCRDLAQTGATGSFPSESNRYRPVLEPFLSQELHSKITVHLPGWRWCHLTLSICRILCFLLRRLCLRMSRDEVLCSVELLNLRGKRANVTSGRLRNLHFLQKEPIPAAAGQGKSHTQLRRRFQLNGSRDQIKNLILQSTI